jgi:serine/threonine protein kinase
VIQTRAEGVLCPKFKGKKYWTINGQDLYVDDRYEVTKKIGFGAYGMVFAAKDNKTGEEVAIKKIQTAFSNLVDAKRVLREIKILSKLLPLS